MRLFLYILLITILLGYVIQFIFPKPLFYMIQQFLLLVFCISLVVAALRHFPKILSSKSWWQWVAMFALVPSALLMPVGVLFKISHWEYGDIIPLASGISGAIGLTGAVILLFRTSNGFSIFLIMSFLFVQVISIYSMASFRLLYNFPDAEKYHRITDELESSTPAQDSLLQVYEQISSLPPEQMTENQRKILTAKDIAAGLTAYIEETKWEFIQEVGFRITEQGDTVLMKEADTQIPTFFFINFRQGYLLRDSIMKSRTELLALIENEEDRAAMAKSFPLIARDEDISGYPERYQGDWVMYNFMEIPAVAVVTILSKLKRDMHAAERVVVEYLVEADKIHQ